MSKPLVSDELWAIIEPLLPEEPLKPRGGRPRVPDRAALTGILFVLRSGIPWEMLPREFGCGSGVTCWRRLRDWQAAGVWDRLHQTLLDRLGEAGQIDWSRAALDAASIPAKRGPVTGPNPTDRGKPGTKRHLVVDRRGVPLASLLTPANTHDSIVFTDLIDAITPIRRMTSPAAGRPSGGGAFRPVSPAGASTPASGWGATAGWSNGPLPGSPASAAWLSATNTGTISTTPSSCSPAPSSASMPSLGFERHS